jgi:hypothetical protein
MSQTCHNFITVFGTYAERCAATVAALKLITPGHGHDWCEIANTHERGLGHDFGVTKWDFYTRCEPFGFVEELGRAFPSLVFNVSIMDLSGEVFRHSVHMRGGWYEVSDEPIEWLTEAADGAVAQDEIDWVANEEPFAAPARSAVLESWRQVASVLDERAPAKQAASPEGLRCDRLAHRDRPLVIDWWCDNAPVVSDPGGVGFCPAYERRVLGRASDAGGINGLVVEWLSYDPLRDGDYFRLQPRTGPQDCSGGTQPFIECPSRRPR